MIRQADKNDVAALAALACRLWPDHSVDEMVTEFGDLMDAPDAACFVAYDEAKKELTFVRRPERSELNADINESLIVEFYSRV